MQFLRQSAKQSASAALAAKGRHTVDTPKVRAERREMIGLFDSDAPCGQRRRMARTTVIFILADSYDMIMARSFVSRYTFIT